MEQILDRLLSRPGLEQAQMAGAAVRRQPPTEAMSTLAKWSEHSSPYARIASGVGYGIVGTRDRDALPDVLPYIERLANDTAQEVRQFGAQAALEQLWMVHTDALSEIVEQWVEEKNDNVKEVVARTIAQVATGGRIRRPSVLKRFIDLGLQLYDRLACGASPRLRTALAEGLDGMGSMAPELVTPFVREWADREDVDSLRLVAEVAKLPFGGLCTGIDLDGARRRLQTRAGGAKRQKATWVREGVGKIDYLPLFAQELLVASDDPSKPWAHVADPYRGCQLRCEFCNARGAEEWVGDTPETFLRRVMVVRNASDLLERALSSEQFEPRERNVLGVGVHSDPYQPAEERFEVTRDVLKLCLAYEHPVVVQTRQELILRDLDLYERLGEKGLVNVLISMQTAIEGIRNKMELGTSTIAERMRCIRMLSKAGVPVGLLLSPVMPDLTDDPAILEETVRRAAEAGARWVVTEVLDLEGSARVKVKLFLDTYISTLVPRYKEVYGQSADHRHADPAYVEHITKDLVAGFAETHGATDISGMLCAHGDAKACLVRS